MDRLITAAFTALWLATLRRLGNRRIRRRMGKLIGLAGAALWLALADGTPAEAFPVAVVASVLATVGVGSALVASIATFVINTAIAIGLNFVAQKVFGPKPAAGPDRQASVLSLTIGEGPRQAIFGRAATGGQLLDIFDWGGGDRTDWEVVVMKVADHKCDALEGFIIGDTFYPFSASGAQSGFNGQLEVYWNDGDPAQAASSYLTTNSPNRLYGTNIWTSASVMASMAVVIFAYKADDPNAAAPIWPQGRPSFKAVVRGKRCYDPRLDSTVTGGSGLQRWATPSTWTWSENAEICRYNYDRGIFAKDQITDPTQLLIGRGLSDREAPAALVAATANICDEAVTLKAGGTEPRYRVGCVVSADEAFGDIEQKFADAMGGDLVKRNGGVSVLPGVAQSTVAEFTDADLVLGEAVSYQPFLSDKDRINTVLAQYVEPAQLWQMATAPARTSSADVSADGIQKNDTPSLDFVTSQTQAQRIAEIRRRRARMEKRLALVLPPPFAYLEDGDWVGYTSARYFGGARIVFQVNAYAVQQSWRNNLVLWETASTAYDWTASTDEGTPGQAPVDEFGSLTALALASPALAAFSLAGTDGSIQPGFKATWTTPVQKGIRSVRLEVRKVGTTDVATFRCDDPNTGTFTGGPIIAGTNMEGRLIPVPYDPSRTVAASSWLPITSTGISLPDLVALISDGELTPGEKVTFVPTINALVGARTNIRAAADAAGLTVASGNTDRANYETACTNLDSYLASLTSPVAWNNLSGNTTIAAPSTLQTRIQDAHTYETALQAATDTAQQSIINSAVQDGTLTPAEKLQVVPIVNSLVSARTTLRTQADAVGLTVASGNVTRAAYETACTNLDSYLATLTSPVAWNTTTANTTISSPSTFRTRLQDQQTTQTNLQTAIDQAAQGLVMQENQNLLVNSTGQTNDLTGWTNDPTSHFVAAFDSQTGWGFVWNFGASGTYTGMHFFSDRMGSAVGATQPFTVQAVCDFAARSSGTIDLTVGCYDASDTFLGNATGSTVALTGGYLSGSFTTLTSTDHVRVFFTLDNLVISSSAGQAKIYKVKLEKGSQATPWNDAATNVAAAVDPRLPNRFRPIGSVPPSVPANSFTYTSTTSSVTISWGTFTIYRADNTTVTISSGSLAITGLSSATTYKVYPYAVDNGTTGPLTMSFATGGTGVGSPADAYPAAGDAAGAAQMYLQGRLPLNGFTLATTSSGSGSGGGGGIGCLHPGQLVGNRRAADLREGDVVKSPEGHTRVAHVSRKACSQWFAVHVDGAPEPAAVVTAEHRFLLAGGGEVRAKALTLGALLATSGDHAEVTALRLLGDVADLVCVELDAPHLYFVGARELLCHNVKP